VAVAVVVSADAGKDPGATGSTDTTAAMGNACEATGAKECSEGKSVGRMAVSIHVLRASIIGAYSAFLVCKRLVPVGITLSQKAVVRMKTDSTLPYIGLVGSTHNSDPSPTWVQLV
jgi:hypothetical protein